jgi:hypothetical protein
MSLQFHEAVQSAGLPHGSKCRGHISGPLARLEEIPIAASYCRLLRGSPQRCSGRQSADMGARGINRGDDQRGADHVVASGGNIGLRMNGFESPSG